ANSCVVRSNRFRAGRKRDSFALTRARLASESTSEARLYPSPCRVQAVSLSSVLPELRAKSAPETSDPNLPHHPTPPGKNAIDQPAPMRVLVRQGAIYASHRDT